MRRQDRFHLLILSATRLSNRGANPFSLKIGKNRISECECCGRLEVGSRGIRRDLHYRSPFRVEPAAKGWMGFSEEAKDWERENAWET